MLFASTPCHVPYAIAAFKQVPTTGEFTKHEFVFALSKTDGSFQKGGRIFDTRLSTQEMKSQCLPQCFDRRL